MPVHPQATASTANIQTAPVAPTERPPPGWTPRLVLAGRAQLPRLALQSWRLRCSGSPTRVSSR